MKNLKSRALLAAMALTASVSATAATVTASQNQTIDGQAFTFALPVVNYLANSPSVLTVTAQGDFNGDNNQVENLSVSIEGVSYGVFSVSSPQAYNSVFSGATNFNAWVFSLDFVLNAATTSAALLDGELDVVVDFGSQVTAVCGWFNASNCLPNVGTSPFASVSFAYEQTGANIPEPAPLALVGLGLAGLAFSRRRKV